MNTKLWKSALALGVCFGVVQAASAQAAKAQNGEVVGGEVESGAASKEYVTLRLNLKPGSEYKMTSVTRTKTVVVMPRFKMRLASREEIAGTTTEVMDYAVLYNNPDGTMQIRLTYNAIKSDFVTKTNGKTTKVPASYAATDALIGQQIGLRISPSGEVSDVRGLDNIWKKAFSAKTPGMTPQMRAQMQAGMKKMLGDNFIKSIMQQNGMMLPENPVQIGSSWTKRLQTTGQLPFVIDLKRTLQGRANGLLSIGESGTMIIGSAKKSLNIGSANLKMHISGTYSGTTLLDETSGFTRSSDIAQHFGGNIKVGAQAQNFTAQMYGLVNTKVTVEKVK